MVFVLSPSPNHTPIKLYMGPIQKSNEWVSTHMKSNFWNPAYPNADEIIFLQRGSPDESASGQKELLLFLASLALIFNLILVATGRWSLDCVRRVHKVWWGARKQSGRSVNPIICFSYKYERALKGEPHNQVGSTFWPQTQAAFQQNSSRTKTSWKFVTNCSL